MPFPQLPGFKPGQRITGQVDYDFSEFEWNKYEFPDGLVVHVFSVPSSIFSTNESDPNGMPVYAIVWNNLLRIVGQENAFGNPTPPIQPQNLVQAPSVDLHPITSSEPWNEFTLTDGHTLREKTVITRFRRISDSFDQTGAPLILVDAQQVIGITNTERHDRQ